MELPRCPDCPDAPPYFVFGQRRWIECSECGRLLWAQEEPMSFYDPLKQFFGKEDK